jgi:hypothetical protein
LPLSSSSLLRLSEKNVGARAAGAQTSTGRGDKDRDRDLKKGSKDKVKDEDSVPDAAKKSAESFTLQLRNAIGAVVDVKTLPFAPKYVAMSSFHAAVANERTVYTWQFQSQVKTVLIT